LHVQFVSPIITHDFKIRCIWLFHRLTLKFSFCWNRNCGQLGVGVDRSINATNEFSMFFWLRQLFITRGFQIWRILVKGIL
jgi:hypothetical protein